MVIDEIIRAHRKSTALVVKLDGRLVVRAPLNVSEEDILALVNKKLDWIEKKKQFVEMTYPKAAHKEYVNGEGFWYLGRIYKLEILDNDQAAPLVLADRFYFKGSLLAKAAAVFESWYRQQAMQVISERVEWYARLSGFIYKHVKVTRANTRWGSCSRAGTLSFAWKLVMAPMPVIDYVVVHELVHTIEKSHRKTFWNHVQILMPDYLKQIEWLDVNGHLLRLD